MTRKNSIESFIRNRYGSVFRVPIIIPSQQPQQEDAIWFDQSQRPTKVSSFQTGGYWLYQQKDVITPSCQSPTQGYHYSFLPRPTRGYHYSFLASPSPTGGYFAWISPIDVGWRLHTWETKDSDRHFLVSSWMLDLYEDTLNRAPMIFLSVKVL